MTRAYLQGKTAALGCRLVSSFPLRVGKGEIVGVQMFIGEAFQIGAMDAR